MHHPTLAFTLSLFTAASLVAVTVVPRPLLAAENGLTDGETAATVAPLMRQAHFLLSHGRADLARGVLQKVLAVQPDHEGALLLLGDLELRSNNNASAQSLWERLQRTRPDSPVTQEMGTLWRLYTTDRLRLVQLRQLRAGGKTAQARVLAHQLFPGDVAPGSLASEFADLLADTPARRQVAIAALQRKVARDGSPQDRFALYNLQAMDRATLAQALQGYAQLAQEHSIPSDQLAGPWSSALRKARSGEGGKEGRALAREQDPLFVRTIPGELRVAAADRGRGGAATNDPVVAARVRGYDALAERRHADAEAAFQEALRLRPGDASSRAGMGIVQLREGRYAQAREWLEQAAAKAPDPQARQDWLDLAASARYWEQVGRARALISEQRWEAADTLLRRTVPLQPDQTEARLLLAATQLQQGRLAEADQLYAQVLAVDPAETRAWRGRFAIGVQQPSGERSADGWLDEAQKQAQRLNVPAGDLIDAGALRAAADRELAAGRAGTALRLLERGVALQGQDPWLRHDLARLYLRDGLPDLARNVMDEGLKQAHQDPQMRYAAALIAQSSDREEDAIALLEGIPQADRSEAQASLATTVRFERALRQYRDALTRGDRDAMQSALNEASANTSGQPGRELRMARAELGAGQTNAARQRLDRLDPASLSFSERTDWSATQAAAGRDTVARDTLTGLAAQARTPEEIDAVLQAQRTIAQDRIAAALDQGRPAQARLAAETGLPGWPAGEGPATAPRALAQAQLWLAARAPEPALASLDAATPPAAPAETAWEWQRTRIEALAAAGRRDEARKGLDALHQQTAQASQPQRLRDIELASDIGEADQARSWLAPLLAAQPTDPDLRLEAARQSRRAGRYNEAMAHLKAAAPVRAQASGSRTPNGTLSPDTTYSAPTPAVQTAMKALEERRQPVAEIGWMQTQYSGDDGISSMRSREIPMVIKWPVGYDGHVFAQVDAVKLDAGTLRPGGPGVGDFGTAATYGGPTSPLPQREQGANVGAGWIGNRQRFDIGVIGLGMPVRNLVGGWQRGFDFGAYDVGVEIARRVEARSLLTYAGAIDPNTGNVWGGVTQTFAAVRVARPLNDTYNLASRLKLSYYDGQHVQHNVAWQWRSVIDRDFVRSEPLNLNAGLAVMFWQFTHNTNFYSYGHGGYYSPQRYVSLSVPVEVTGRQGTWSYLVRASLGHSWTHEDSAPYYPLDPALTPNGGTYAGGSGGGLGGSLRAAIEKRIAPQWSVGAWIDIERSESYSPNRAMIYLRHFFKPQSSPVPVPPQPVIPYSQF